MNTEVLTRRLSAILSADVEGYSRLMRDDEEATVRTITNHRTAMTHMIEQYRGRVVDSPGDNILAEFTSVVDAVNCGVEIQRELAERNAELPENRRMQFRIGINLGDVLEEGDRIYGDGVNIAARMESLAEAGGICISGTVYNAIENKIGLEYEDLGNHKVKNIDKPIRAYKVLSYPGAAAHRVVKAKRAVGKTWRNSIIAIAAVLVVCAGAAIWHIYFRPPPIEPASEERMAFPLPDKPSIAVLPFTNMSGDPEQEYFSDGLTEEIISALSKVPELFVIARNSTFTYKGKSVKVQQVSEELGVRHVLEGSVRKAGDRVRITAQLIDATTGHHLWSERYDRDLKDIFALQDEITIKIINALQVKLTEGEHARLWGKGTKNLKAYLTFLQAREHAICQTKEDNILARRLAKETIALDPEYPNSYELLAYTHMMDVWLKTTKSPKQSMKRAMELAQKAIALDESLAEAHGLLSFLYTMSGQHDKGVAEGKRAVDIDPNGANSHAWFSTALRYAGRHEEALKEAEKALRLNPFHPEHYFFRTLAIAYIFAGRYQEAIAACRKGLNRSPNDLNTHIYLTAAYSLSGREKEARAEAEEVFRIDPKFSLKYAAKTWPPYKNQADRDLIIHALRKAGIPEHPPLPLPDKPSIAVLPFVNMSDDENQEYFADGMTDTLITDLSKVSGLFVIARNSVFTYKGKSVKVEQIGRELRVRYVLEGSVQRADNQVRINAQLIDTKTSGHVWAERFDGKIDDIFALQDNMTGKIVSLILAKLAGKEKLRVSQSETKNILAYDELLKGMQYYNLYTPESFDKAVAHFKKSLSFDPNYGKANAALALTYWNGTELGSEGLVSLGEPWSQARLLAVHYLKRAMKSPNPIAYQIRAQVLLMRRQHDQAITEAKRAISIDPNDPNGQLVMAFSLIMDGRPEDSTDFAKKAIQLDPLNPARPLSMMGLASFCNGDIEEALEFTKRALRHNPKLFKEKTLLAACYAILGKSEKAQVAIDSFAKYDPFAATNLKTVMYLWPFKDLKVSDRLADGLIKAGLPDEHGGYFRISRENKLGGNEIEDLLFGRKVKGIVDRGWEWSVERTKDGLATLESYYGSETGRSWVDGDMICDDFPFFWVLGEHCAFIFHNPYGNFEMKNQYVMITDFGMSSFSPIN